MATEVLLRFPGVRALLAAAVVAPLLWAPVTIHAADTRYHGRVIDAESKAPIQGAVVVVVWLTYPRISMDGVGSFHEAREVLTDATGGFSVDATPRINWNPFKVVREPPALVVFKPGYGRYPEIYGTTSWPNLVPIEQIHDAVHDKREVTIELPRLEGPTQIRLFAGPDLHPGVPYARVPVYIGLINEHRRALGLEPLDPRQED